MEIEISKWGNSLAVRIPIHLVKELSLHEGEKAELFSDEGKLILQPKQHEYSLEELVSRITPENIHEEFDFGSPVGLEEM